ncbi:MAG: hypothetical protein ACI959_001053 [Limisphaerales bacterium]|jgi:hypothetical protein
MPRRIGIIIFFFFSSLAAFSQKWVGDITVRYNSENFNGLFGSTEIMRAVIETKTPATNSCKADGLTLSQSLNWDERKLKFFLSIDTIKGMCIDKASLAYQFANLNSHIDSSVSRSLLPFNWSARLKSQFQPESIQSLWELIQFEQGHGRMPGTPPLPDYFNAEDLTLLLVQDIYFDSTVFGMQSRVVRLEWMAKNEKYIIDLIP